MFEFLFNHSENVWQNAELVYTSGWPLHYLYIAIAAAFVCVVIALLRQPLGRMRRAVVALLQGAVLATLLWMVWQPHLKLDVMQPGENTIAYLLDTSASMQQADGGANGTAQTRMQQALDLLEQDQLNSNDIFDATGYLIANELSPWSMNGAPEAAGTRSRLADGLLGVLERVGEQSLAAVVLLSDGADNSTNLTSQWWQRIKSAGVPVHTVGFGSTVIENDAELAAVDIDSAASINSPISASFRIIHNGVTDARLRITSGDELVHVEELTLDPQQPESLHRVTFNSGDAGVRRLSFALVTQSGEANLANNRQQRVVQVADKPRRVLYVEGEPRWEYKFIRRALDADKGTEVVSLLKTSPNKFYRQGVRDAKELADGFPQSRAELFAYDAVVIGSLEAAELNVAQQANLRDFVSERGGSLMLLAGRDGLADGGWGRSAVAVALPVTLSSSTRSSTYERQRVSVQPTRQGLRTPWLRFDDDAVLNRNAWDELPEVADNQIVGDIKPGATVLLQTAGVGPSIPVLVWHRYGQGQSYVFGTSGTWRWQMRMDAKNQSHEIFWQQLLSQLVSSSLPQMTFEHQASVHRDTDQIAVAVLARNSDFTPLADGQIEATVSAPDGSTSNITLLADINQPGRFVGSVTAKVDGPYALSVATPISGEAQAAAIDTSPVQQWFVRETGTAELFNTAQNSAFLKRVASISGGTYLQAGQSGELAELLATSNAGLTREEFLPLWNMPILFLWLIFAKCVEWLLRLRWKRL